jgi:rod shape-determining protein MreD
VRVTRVLRDAAVIAVLVVVAVLLQVTVAVDFELLSGAPDFVCVVLVSVALLRGAEVGALTGFCAGFLLDAVTGQPMGLSCFVLTAVGFAAGRFGEKVPERAAIRPLGVVAVLSVVTRIGMLLLGVLIASDITASQIVSIAVVPTAALDVLIAIPVYPLIRRALRAPLPVPTTIAPTTPPESAPPALV